MAFYANLSPSALITTFNPEDVNSILNIGDPGNKLANSPSDTPDSSYNSAIFNLPSSPTSVSQSQPASPSGRPASPSGSTNSFGYGPVLASPDNTGGFGDPGSPTPSNASNSSQKQMYLNPGDVGLGTWVYETAAEHERAELMPQ
jgi:hypothetical protein